MQFWILQFYCRWFWLIDQRRLSGSHTPPPVLAVDVALADSVAFGYYYTAVPTR